MGSMDKEKLGGEVKAGWHERKEKKRGKTRKKWGGQKFMSRNPCL